MKLKYCKECINYDKDNNTCVPTILSVPKNIKKIKLCPCDRLFEGKHKFQRIRDIIKTDPKYIKQLLDGTADVSIRDTEMLKDYLREAIKQVNDYTEEYLKASQEIQEKLK